MIYLHPSVIARGLVTQVERATGLVATIRSGRELLLVKP